MASKLPSPISPAVLGAAICLAASAAAGDGDPTAHPDGPPLDAEGVEHLLNRFAFGAPPAEIEGWVGRRAGEIFDELLEGSQAPPPADLFLIRWEEYGVDRNGNELLTPEQAALPMAELRVFQRALRQVDRTQFEEYFADWIGDMLVGHDSLRNRLTLYWHGHFPTNVRVIFRRHDLIRQHETLRRYALGSFRDLLHAMVRDPALLAYFDNDASVAGHPHENLARELLELYTLGEGRYDEQDVREAARALTGYQGGSGEFHFERSVHDSGEKTIFGRTGRFDGDDLVELILAHPGCAVHIAGRLLEWFEGWPADRARVAHYAQVLVDAEYELTPWLRHLAVDPEFYRPAILGQRVMAPLELLVSAARRAELRPDPNFVFFGAARLGQLLCGHPSVKGWNEGEEWLTTELFMHRNQVLGLLVGALEEAPDGSFERLAPGYLAELSKETRAANLEPPAFARGLRDRLGPRADDGSLLEYCLSAWLARPLDADTRARATHFLAGLRVEAALGERPVLESPAADALLRRLAHFALSLPLAQLH